MSDDVERLRVSFAKSEAKEAIRRALEIGCVVHTCSAKPGAMCDPTPDNHGPPADMDPEKGPWYGVHHRRWLTWLRENKGNRGGLTAAEQVYICDACDAPVNVPCMHMRGPGLGKGEIRVVGQTQYPDGNRGVTAVVTDPAMIKLLEDGGRPVSVGYDPSPSRTAGFDHLYGAALYAKAGTDKVFVRTADGVDHELPREPPPWKKIDPLPVDTNRDPEQLQAAGVAYMTPEQVQQDLVVGIQPANEFACPAMIVGKYKPAITCRKRRGHPGDHFAPVGDHGAYYTWKTDASGPLGQMYTLHPAPVTFPVPEWKSAGASEIVDATPPENYEAIEKMIRDQLIREGAHLRSVPMDNPDDIDTVVARNDRVHPGDCSIYLPYDHAPGAPGCVVPQGAPDPAFHPFKPSAAEDGVSCEDCGLPKEAHKRTMSSSLAWFKDQAARALKVNPNITMAEFIDRIGEPEYETEIQRAYHLTEDQFLQALANIGCDFRCAACSETFFSGSTDHPHRCAMLAKLKCILCGKPTAPKSQMCEDHERQEADEIEGIIAANKELNGSSADTRKFAIAKMNELDQYPGMYGHTLEGLRSVLLTLLQISGVRPDGLNAFQDFFRQAVQKGDAAEPSPGNDPYGEVIAHARGMVLAIQLLREGPQDAPSPLKLMLPKPPKSET